MSCHVTNLLMRYIGFIGFGFTYSILHFGLGLNDTYPRNKQSPRPTSGLE